MSIQKTDTKASNRRDRTVFATAMTINSVGNGLFLTVSALYFIRVVDISLGMYGLALAIAAGAGLIVGPLVGHVADRLGSRTLYILLLAVQGIGSALYILAGNPVLIAMILCMVSIAERGAAATRGAFIAALVTREGRVMFRAKVRSLTNAGGAIGAGAGSFVLIWDTPLAYQSVMGFNAVTFFIASALMLITSKNPGADVEMNEVRPLEPEPRVKHRFDKAMRDRPFLVITLLNAVLLLHVSITNVALPLWVAERTDAPLWIVSVVVVINTIGVVFLQVPASKNVKSVADAARVGHRSAMLLGVTALLLAATGYLDGLATIALIVAAALAHLGGELFQAASAWAFAFELAPEDAQGQYQGVFNAGLDIGMLVSPLLFTLIVAVGGSIGWMAVAAVFFIVGFLLGPASRWAQTSRQGV